MMTLVTAEHREILWTGIRDRLRPFLARRVAADADVDDVLQEVLLRIQKSASQVKDDERFGAWVYQVARSAVADHRRQRARHPLASADAPPLASEVDDEADRVREIALENLAAVIAPFVARLPEPYRQAVAMTELDGLTQREAAERLGVSLSGMKSRVQRGREKLRDMLVACCELAIDARGRIVDCTPRDLTAQRACCSDEGARDPASGR